MQLYAQAVVSEPDPTSVADRLHSAAIHLLRGLRKADEETGLSAARLSALSVVVFGGPVTLGQLAEAEQVSAPTMTRLVAGMQADGLVRRSSDANDRRVVWISATTRGKRILQEGRERRIARLSKLLVGVDPSELSLLDEAVTVLQRITRELGRPV